MNKRLKIHIDIFLVNISFHRKEKTIIVTIKMSTPLTITNPIIHSDNHINRADLYSSFIFMNSFSVVRKKRLVNKNYEFLGI